MIGKVHNQLYSSLTAWIVTVHPKDAFLVSTHNGHVTVSKEKVCYGDTETSHILGDNEEFVGILLNREGREISFTIRIVVRTWKATNQTLLTASPITSKFLRVWSDVT